MSISKQLYLDALTKEFKLKERRVPAAWLDPIDCDPDPNNREHWEHFLIDEERNLLFQVRWFPQITVRNRFAVDETLGIIIIKEDVTTKDMIWYFHNVLDR